MLNKQLRFLFSARSLGPILRFFVGSLRLLWLFIEFTSFFFPGASFFSDPRLFLFILGVSALFALARAFPRTSFEHRSSYSDVTIKMKVGDIFTQNTDLALVTSDHFDTVDEDQQKGRSLKMQMIERIFNGNTKEVDAQIDRALKAQHLSGVLNQDKNWGKKLRFPIGSIARLTSDNIRYYLTVACRITNGRDLEMSKDELWEALSKLWRFIGRDNQTLAVPVWGAGQSRARASRRTLLQTLLLSFALATRERKVVDQLVVVIYESDYDPAEFQDAIQFIKSLDF